MAAPKSTDSPLKTPSGTGAESPTTVRPLDMDDDDVQETNALSGDAPTNTAADEQGPPKPPRPLSAQQQAENTLKEAFPSIDVAVVKAVLIASGGRVEPAFNALLGMSDPSAVIEPTPPVQPPRPAAVRPGSTPQSQLEADEQYARQLAEQYGGYERSGNRGSGHEQRRKETGLKPNELHDDNYSFLDDDLPVIKENLRKGFLETQTTVNKWITNLKKKIDGDDFEEEGSSSRPQRGGYGPQGPGAQYGRRSGDNRRSGEYNRYDADPQLLGDDFAGIQLNDDGSPAQQQQRRSTRPLANPDLFKPTPATPRSNDGRKVAFQSGPDEDIYSSSSPKISTSTPASAKQSKWQPLSTVEPSPVGDGDNDPFSLGDSEDERESKERVVGKEIKQEDTDRLKKAASETEAVKLAKGLEPTETSGTKDKIAADITK